MKYSVLDKYEGKTGYDLFAKGDVIIAIDELSNILKKENDLNLLKRLNSMLGYINNASPEKLISDMVSKNGVKEYRYNGEVLKYLISFYRDGVIGKNKKHIISPNEELSNYYLYVYIRRIVKDNALKGYKYSKFDKLLIQQYNKNFEKIECDYFRTIKNRYKRQHANAKFSKKMQLNKQYLISLSSLIQSKSEYVRLLSILESLKFGELASDNGKTNLEAFESIVKENIDRENGCNTDVRRVLAKCYTRGVANNVGNDIIEPNLDIAKRFGISKKYKAQNKKSKSNKSGKTYVCGDIHGQFDIYKRIIEDLKPEDTLYIIGDVIDRGPDGIKILQDLIKVSKTKNVQFLMGNHEYMMLISLTNSRKGVDGWISSNNGGSVTYNDYLSLSEEERKAILTFLAKLPVAKNITVNNQRFQLVHANRCKDFTTENIYFRDIVASKDKDKLKELLDMLSSRAYDSFQENAYVVVGHTPNASGKIEINDKYIKIDCGLSTRIGGNLGLLCLDNMQQIYYSLRSPSFEKE